VDRAEGPAERPQRVAGSLFPRAPIVPALDLGLHRFVSILLVKVNAPEAQEVARAMASSPATRHRDVVAGLGEDATRRRAEVLPLAERVRKGTNRDVQERLELAPRFNRLPSRFA